MTVFGESAGGTNVNSLLLSPQARRPVPSRHRRKRRLLRSSTVTQAENFTDDAQPGDANSSNEVLLRLLIADGTVDDRAAAKQRLASDERRPRYERATCAANRTSKFSTAYTPIPRAGMINMPAVFREGVVLPTTTPCERLRAAGRVQPACR